MTSNPHLAAETEAHEDVPDSEFESYYDRDSASWSLRRIPSSPPSAASEGEDV